MTLCCPFVYAANSVSETWKQSAHCDILNFIAVVSFKMFCGNKAVQRNDLSCIHNSPEMSALWFCIKNLLELTLSKNVALL